MDTVNRNTAGMLKSVLAAALGAALLCACARAQNSVQAGGSVECDQYDVFSQVSGKIVRVSAQEGDAVRMGETVTTLDDTDAKNAVAQAQAQLKSAQANLDNMTAGTRPELIQQARAQLKSAQAKLAELKAGARPEQIAAADAASAAAKANLDNLKAGNRPQQIQQAQTQVDQAMTDFDNAQQNYDYAQSTLERISGMLAGGTAPQSDADAAQNAADNAKSALNNAKNQLNIAQSQLSLLQSGATDDAIAAAQAQYDQALAAARDLKNGATKQSLDAAQAAVDQAQANVDYLQNGHSKQEIDQAQAAADQARAVLDGANNQLEKYQIKSPVSGVLLYKNMDVGEVANPGSNVFTVQSDDKYWIRIYIPQKYNGRIAVGDAVSVTASNLPDKPVSGAVTWISPQAEFTPKNIQTMESKQENTVFAVKVTLDNSAGLLMPGMNATVTLGLK